nr:CopG family ribbon-helix-helix protein [Methylopila sp. M107]
MATSIKLDDELKSRVKELADQRRRSAHWIMREAVEQYVTHAEAREDFLREGDESWAHYKQTGLHLTLDEVCEWLDTWGTDGEKEPPECHD